MLYVQRGATHCLAACLCRAEVAPPCTSTTANLSFQINISTNLIFSQNGQISDHSALITRIKKMRSKGQVEKEMANRKECWIEKEMAKEMVDRREWWVK
jgi:hypothetical protein